MSKIAHLFANSDDSGPANGPFLIDSDSGPLDIRFAVSSLTGLQIERLSWTKRSWLFDEDPQAPEPWLLTILFKSTESTVYRKAIEMIVAVQVGKQIWRKLEVEFFARVSGQHHIYFVCKKPPVNMINTHFIIDNRVPVTLHLQDPSDPNAKPQTVILQS